MSDTPVAPSLLPWVRRGLASLIAGPPAAYYASLPVSLAVNGAAVNAPPIRLLGPGDITALDARAVIRTEPRDGAGAFEPNYLAAVELAFPDLPWMFSPAAPANGRLRPWICLIVLPDTAGAAIETRRDGPAVLLIDQPLDPQAELPDLDQIDAWAHAQVMGDGDLAATEPNGATLSRLIAPRRLEPGKRYLACVVPTYRAGVNAGLGLPVDDHDLAPAWDSHTSAPFRLPVYHQFRFQTGPDGDFASLARRIRPPKTPIDGGTRPMDVSEPGFGAAPAPGLTLGLEGALRTLPLDPQSAAWPAGAQEPYEAQLRKALAPPVLADPVVAPPTYGRAQSGSDLPATGAPPLWLGELNLDPRTRAAAGAGAQVVQRDQEALVASAWDQLGEIRKANQLLRQAQLARQVSASLNARHLDTLAGDGTYLQITAPLHGRVKTAGSGTTTLRAQMQASRLPVDTVSPAMRKLSRPRGPVGRQLGTAAGMPQLLERLNMPAASGTQALVVAGPVQAPRGMVALDDVSPAVQVARMKLSALRTAVGWRTTAVVAPTSPTGPIKERTAEAQPIAAERKVPLIDWAADTAVPDLLKTPRPNLPAPLVFPTDATILARTQETFRSAASAVTRYVSAAPVLLPEPPPLGGSPALAPARLQLRARLLPEATIPARLKARLPLNTGADPLQPLKAGPQFPQAMYAPLAALAPEWMLPGIAKVPIDTAALLATNPPFVESFLIGINEELARELLWREVPTDRQGTFFRTFWGAGAPDIPLIAAFDANGHLGDHMADHATGGNLVLLIRAELFRRYPNAVVSAVSAIWNSDGTRGLDTDRQSPIFRGEIGADVTFFGFKIDDPRGSADPHAGKPGCYFLIEEHATEPRFGLEPEISTKPDGTWNELSWPEVVLDRSFLNPVSPPHAAPSREGVAWGESAAAMAFILMRRPVRIALHGRALLGTEGA